MADEKAQTRIVTVHGDVEVAILSQDDSNRRACEREILDSGFPLPLHHRTQWLRFMGGPQYFVAARRTGERWSYGFAVTEQLVRPARHRRFRIERLGPPFDEMLLRTALDCATAWARSQPRTLQIDVELFSSDGPRRAMMASELRSLGYQPLLEQQRSYRQTGVVDLRPSEEEIFANFTRNTRRDCRAFEKHRVELKRIDGLGFDERMQELHVESWVRTGSVAIDHDWGAIQSLSRCEPSLSCLLGLFHLDRSAPESLLAYAWGVNHGDHSCYLAGASTREAGLKLPLAHGLLWALMRWARSQGSQWFDMGGVTLHRAGDPLAGISAFKRRFSTRIEEVGEEWCLEASPLRRRIIDIGRGFANFARTRWR